MNVVQFDLAAAPRIEIEEAKKRFDMPANVIFVDVRYRADYEKAHIPGAVSLPLREVFKRYGELASEKEIITY